MNSRYELIHLSTHGEFYLAQFAVDGHLTESFWVHRSIRDDPRHRSEAAFMAKLADYAETMLEQFGTVRERAA